MSEVFAPVEAPTNVVFGFYDDHGNFAVRPLGYRQDDAGNRTPFFKCDEDTAQQAGSMINSWRAGLRAEALSELRDVPRADTQTLQLDRVDHFYAALGLPSVPTVAVADARDLPHDGGFKGYAQHFHNSPNLAGAYFDTPKLLVVADKTSGGFSGHDLEYTTVHEKAHGTGPTTVAVMLRPDGKMQARVVRNGFKVVNPISGQHIDDLKEHNERPEEAQAEMFAAIYADLFLDRPDTVSVHKSVLGTGSLMEIDGKYQQDPVAGSVGVSAPLALGLELLIEQDPNIFDQLLAARLGINGLRRFAQLINNQIPGMYSEFVKRRVGWMSNNFFLDTVVDKFHKGDRDVLKKTGSVVTSLVVGKLRAYEQQTGYDFGLPVSPTTNTPNGVVPLEPKQLVTTAQPESAGPASDDDEITALLNKVKDTL